MTYEIRENRQYNSHEVYFDAIPPFEVRDALKGLKMKWNRKKACWYGFASESELIAAIQGHDEATVITDGYMGGGAIYGSKSDKALYGSDLSKAIRQDIKAAGIKGATVSCKSYSGGQSILVKVKVHDEDMADLAEFAEGYEIKGPWFYTGTEQIRTDVYYAMDAAQQKEVREAAAKYEWERSRGGIQINNYHCSNYPVYSQKFLAKLEAINSIVAAYRYDESNGMVDYYSTNFYYTIETVGA
nr:MAG TPA: hypothetical protein [Caudoviricetes sp.]